MYPNPYVIACANGAKTNWPNDPPAFINPPANDLFSLGRFFAVAPISIEKLPARAPTARRSSKVRIIENS